MKKYVLSLFTVIMISMVLLSCGKKSADNFYYQDECLYIDGDCYRQAPVCKDLKEDEIELFIKNRDCKKISDVTYSDKSNPRHKSMITPKVGDEIYTVFQIPDYVEVINSKNQVASFYKVDSEKSKELTLCEGDYFSVSIDSSWERTEKLSVLLPYSTNDSRTIALRKNNGELLITRRITTDGNGMENNISDAIDLKLNDISWRGTELAANVAQLILTGKSEKTKEVYSVIGYGLGFEYNILDVEDVLLTLKEEVHEKDEVIDLSITDEDVINEVNKHYPLVKQIFISNGYDIHSSDNMWQKAYFIFDESNCISVLFVSKDDIGVQSSLYQGFLSDVTKLYNENVKFSVLVVDHLPFILTENEDILLLSNAFSYEDDKLPQEYKEVRSFKMSQFEEMTLRERK